MYAVGQESRAAFPESPVVFVAGAGGGQPVFYIPVRAGFSIVALFVGPVYSRNDRNLTQVDIPPLFRRGPRQSPATEQYLAFRPQLGREVHTLPPSRWHRFLLVFALDIPGGSGFSWTIHASRILIRLLPI